MQHTVTLVQDFAVILGLGSLVSLLFQRIKQPVVLGYLVAGIVAGPYTPPFSLVLDLDGVRIWAELGVILLMFTLGLEFNLVELRRIGRTALVTGPFETLVMLVLGTVSGSMMGWSNTDSLYLGAILSISSTTIIIKTIDELGIKSHPFVRQIFGILIVEDVLGILILIAFTMLSYRGQITGWDLLTSGMQLLLVVAGWLALGLLVVPRLVDYVGRTSGDEAMVLLTLALSLGLGAISQSLHYSGALGSFVMGVLISESRELARIERLILPIRNIFATVFFVSIGMLLNPVDIITHWQAVLIISVITVLGKIAGSAAGARMTGQSWKTSLQIGLGLAQIGEFSFIIAGLGVSLGKVSPMLYSLAVAVSIITTFTTPYLIRVALALKKPVNSLS